MARLPNASEAKETAPRPAEPAQERLGLGWRLALFVWATSFGFLCLYELLSFVFRIVARAGGS
jgi:hypothetical protein